MKNSKTKENCSVCGNHGVETILDLGATPLADQFIDQESGMEEWFPLKVQYCHDCGLAQLSEVVNDDILFKNDYAFFTGSSPSAVTHFQSYAHSIAKQFPNKVRNGRVLEIASNDGTFLKALKKCGAGAVLGVDPADSVQQAAKDNNVPTIHGFFNLPTAEHILRITGKQDIIVANNVVAHVDDLHEFSTAINLLLKDDGVFVAEFQYFPQLISRGLFDNVYHEHRYYLGIKPIQRLFKRYGLEVYKVEHVDTQGGSVRVYISRAISGRYPEDPNSVDECIAVENAIPSTIDTLQKKADKCKAELRPLIEKLKAEGKSIYAYGASAKGNTLLNWCNIDRSIIEHIVDKTPYKFDKYSPGMHLLVSDQDMMELPDYYLLLVHNYADSIVARETYFTQHGGKFIIPIPNIKII